MYAYEINDFSYYFNSFNTNLPAAEIDSIASNVKQIMGKDPSDTQLIESQITNIFKSNTATSMMEHSKLVQFLHDELRKLGFKDLEEVDILKYATIVRDPVTKESV